MDKTRSICVVAKLNSDSCEWPQNAVRPKVSIPQIDTMGRSHNMFPLDRRRCFTSSDLNTFGCIEVKMFAK